MKAASSAWCGGNGVRDCSTSEATNNARKTCGRANDWATLILPGKQQELLKRQQWASRWSRFFKQAVLMISKAKCAVILVELAAGTRRWGPATSQMFCLAIIIQVVVYWMTFPRHVDKLPYGVIISFFKTSVTSAGICRYGAFIPLYRFAWTELYFIWNIRTQLLVSSLKWKMWQASHSEEWWEAVLVMKWHQL